MSDSPRILVVGAGLSGLLLAALLARRSLRVAVYERRADPRLVGDTGGGRSINLALSRRGLHALEQVGLADEVLARSIPMRGRMIHLPNDRLRFQPYSRNPADCLSCVSRAELNLALLREASRLDGVEIHFGHRCVGADLEAPALQLTPAGSRERIVVPGDLLVGADGAFSVLRSLIARRDRFSYEQQYIDYGYKELTIPAVAGGRHRMEKHALHIWPRRRLMLIALPNNDGSFTCTLFLPFTGRHGFAELVEADRVGGFLARAFPDIAPYLPAMVEEFQRNPTGSLVTIRCRPWSFRDKAVLIGDACHAVLPFYGQGMNAAFEDCTVLDACLRKAEPSIASALSEFEKLRRGNTDLLADLSQRHFIEMRDYTSSRLFLLRKGGERLLHRLFPRWFLPLYNMVTFSRIPYVEAFRRARQQRRWAVATLLLLFALLAATLLSMARGTRLSGGG